MKGNRRRLAVGLFLLLLALAALRDLNRLGAAAPWRGMDDFGDFYCAGDALDAGASPYTYEPLRGCEHRVNVGDTFRARLFESNPAVAVPAPQPPFDFLPFMALAKLPFAAARVIGGVAILTAVALGVVVLAALGVPWELAAAALALSTAYEGINTGQIVPFALLALVLSGLALARGNDALAGILAALVAIEPAAGLPVIAAALLFVPRARIAIVAALVGLAGCSFALVGPVGVLHYVAIVLPAHAASELHFPYQYSLTYALAFFGSGSESARLAGAFGYLALVGAGLALAPKVAAALRRRELLLFVPGLCSVIGGAFVHAEELCFALPAVLVFAVNSEGRQRFVAALATCALAIPWIVVWGEKQLFLTSLFACAVVLLRLQIDLRLAAGALAAIAAVMYGFELQPPHLPVPAPGSLRAYAPAELAQNVWRDYTEARSTRDPLWFAIKLPSWIALLAALALAASFARRSPRASETSP